MVLNEKQKKVVYTNERFLFLLAGAGSGKTRVLIERINHLLSTGVCPGDILAITFTHKASIEMKERLRRGDVDVHTFHQYALRVLKSYSNYTHKILDEPINGFEQKDILDISIYKNHLYQTRKPKAYDIYEKYLNYNGLKDFDDLLIDLYHMLQRNKQIKKYQYIFIDEFQDTNDLQYKILKILIDKNTKVLAVGDPDQSIYKFRGANLKIIEAYIKDYHARVEILDINYRSSPDIINMANRFIEGNIRTLKKQLIAYNEDNYETKKVYFDSLMEESDFIINHYKKFILLGIDARQIAVIFRNHRRSYCLRNMIKSKYIDQVESLQLITMHQAKGLEFEVVFIIGLEEGECPSYHGETYASLEEERRLMYVAVTRAKKYLYLTYTKVVDNRYKKKSVFFKEIKI